MSQKQRADLKARIEAAKKEWSEIKILEKVAGDEVRKLKEEYLRLIGGM